MQRQRVQVGRALTRNRARTAYFEDAIWDDRVEKLIKRTQRTSMIIELTGTDSTSSRMKSYVLQRLKELGITPNLPRGNPPSYESKSLLKTEDDRIDAAYLVALHYGPRGPGEFSEVEADLGQALDKRLEVYGRYSADLYPGNQTPRLGFEDYVVLIQGIQKKVIAMYTCRDCKATHAYSTVATVQPTCPFCNRMKLEMAKARTEVERRYEQRRSARFQPTAVHQFA